MNVKYFIPLLTGFSFFSASGLATAGELPQFRRDEPIKPLVAPEGLDPRKIRLGRTLFSDTRLSRDGTVSCSSCHNLQKGGADQKALSLGIGAGQSEMNAPTVLNSGLNFRQFWDGRADTLEDQVEGPIHHPNEMGSKWEEIIGKLKSDPAISDSFASIYPAGIDAKNIKDAIVTFERSLVTLNSPFDLYLRGSNQAITAEAREGYRRFKNFGCIACHQGANVGGNMFQTMGVMAKYFEDRGAITKADGGRFNATGKISDRHVFKVPSLRNVALTAPYFHDGSAKTLRSAIEVMAKYQLGRKLTEEDLTLIEKFLHTLTGESPATLTGAEPR